MLFDRGLLRMGEGGHEAVGDLEALDVPETLHARSLDHRPWIAGTLTDYAGSLVADGRPAEALPFLAEAREIAEELRAVRLLLRIERLEASTREPAPAG
jgi:hypothetical protein